MTPGGSMTPANDAAYKRKQREVRERLEQTINEIFLGEFHATQKAVNALRAVKLEETQRNITSRYRYTLPNEGNEVRSVEIEFYGDFTFDKDDLDEYLELVVVDNEDNISPSHIVDRIAGDLNELCGGGCTVTLWKTHASYKAVR